MKEAVKMTWKEYKDTWLSHNTCRFCQGSHMHTCTSYSCRPAFKKAEEYFGRVIARDEVAAGKRKFVTELTPRFTKESLERYMVSGVWIIRNFQRKELVVRFRDSVPEMQQSACLLMVKKLICNAAASKGQDEQIICSLLDGMKARAWRPEDEDVIRMGIPCGDIRQGEMQQSEVPTLKG